jgi:uncharacterized repeat protein (TIGR01451 family)
MKAFGVRFAAGALTILFGAYAAALAQKEKQNDTESWSADATHLGQPAAPIADIRAADWISQPEADGEQPVQLVQHSEPIDSAAAPNSFAIADLEETLDEPGDVPVPDWTLPGADTVATDGAQAATAPAAMSLPGSDTDALPELEIGVGPVADFSAATELPSSEANAGQATATLGIPTSGIPANDLRSAPGSPNLLRGEPTGDAPQPLDHWSDPNAQEPASDSPNHDGPMHDGPAPSPFAPAPQANPYSQSDQYSPADGYPPADQYSPADGYPPTGQANRQLSEPQLASSGAALSPTGQAAALAHPAQTAGAALAINQSDTIDAPGDRRLEGAQTPSIVIQKRAPSEVKVGQPATFVIHVQNVGAVEALDVMVHDKVPAGMRLIDASPTPVQQGNTLMWQLGAMPAGDEQTVSMQLVPEQEGELGSVARVSFEAAASVRTIATRPELKIVQNAPETVLIGQQLEIELEVSNPGTGEATNVVLQEDVPPGLEHPKGRQLDNAMGNLAPGEIRRQLLRMKAVAPGIVQNTIRLTGDDGLTSEHTVTVQVVAPELQVALEGPSRRFLERQATYHVHLGNVGTADATNVEVAVQLDRGFTFVSTENQGTYDPSRHSVHWSLAQLPAGANGKVALTLLPVQEGEQAITLDARADLGVLAKNERRLSVEGFSELSFSIANPGGPIELGAETTYEIKVANRGSKADSNIQVQLQLPAGLELVSAQGDAGTDGRGLVAFQPQATLAPGSEYEHKIRVRGVAPGTHIVKAVVVSDLATTPVTKEESTVVYADQ